MRVTVSCRPLPSHWNDDEPCRRWVYRMNFDEVRLEGGTVHRTNKAALRAGVRALRRIRVALK